MGSWQGRLIPAAGPPNWQAGTSRPKKWRSSCWRWPP